MVTNTVFLLILDGEWARKGYAFFHFDFILFSVRINQLTLNLLQKSFFMKTRYVSNPKIRFKEPPHFELRHMHLPHSHKGQVTKN